MSDSKPATNVTGETTTASAGGASTATVEDTEKPQEATTELITTTLQETTTATTWTDWDLYHVIHAKLLRALHPTEPKSQIKAQVDLYWQNDCALQLHAHWEMQAERMMKLDEKRRLALSGELLTLACRKLMPVESESLSFKLEKTPPNWDFEQRIDFIIDTSRRLIECLAFPMDDKNKNIPEKQRNKLVVKYRIPHDRQLWALRMRANGLFAAVDYLVPPFTQRNFLGFDSREHMMSMFRRPSDDGFWLFAAEQYVPVALGSVSPERAMHLLVTKWWRNNILPNQKESFMYRTQLVRGNASAQQLLFDMTEVLEGRYTEPIKPLVRESNEPIPAEYLFFIDKLPEVQHNYSLLNARQHDVILVQMWNNLNGNAQDVYYDRCHERLAAHYAMAHGTDYCEELNILKKRRHYQRLAKEYNFPAETPRRKAWALEMKDNGFEAILNEFTYRDETGIRQLKTVHDLNHDKNLIPNGVF